MHQLVVVAFECWYALSSFVLHHRYFGRRPRRHALDLGVGPSCAGYLICSMYAGGSCDSNVPFGDMCNTQLRVGLFVFRLPFLVGGILLLGRMCYLSLSPGLLPRFLLHVLVFAQLMCPLHLGRITFAGVSILVGATLSFLRGAP